MLEVGTVEVKLKADSKKAKEELEEFKETTEDVEKQSEESTEKIDDSWKKLSKTMKTAVVAGIAAVAAGITELVSITNETQEHIGKLNTAFNEAGFSAESANDTFMEFVGLMGETDTAVEASNHLAKLCKSEEELATWTDIAAGVFATFGDSLPLEGLTEAANETAKTGKVVGVLADALNWAGISEDEFNAQLAECSSEQERSAKITATLNSLYKEVGDKYKDNNKNLIEYRKSQAELNKKLSELGNKLLPIVSKGMDVLSDVAEDVFEPIIESVSDLVEWFGNLDEGTQQAIVSLGLGAAAAKPLGNAFGTIREGATGAIKGIGGFIKEIKGGAKPTQILTKGLSGMGGAIDLVAGLLIGAAINAMAEAAKNTENYKEATEGLTKVSNIAAKSIDEINSSLGEHKVEVDGVSESVDNYARSATEAAEAGAKLTEALNQKWEDVELDTTHLNNYINTIESLQGKTSLTAAEQMALENAVKGVNEITGSTIEVINAETGELSVSTEELKKNTQQWILNAKAKAAEESYTEIIKEQIEVERDLNAQKEERNRLEKEVNDGAWWKGHELDEANAKVQRLQEQYDTLTDSANDYVKIHESAEIERYIGETSELSTRLDELGISYTDAANNIASFGLSVADVSTLTVPQFEYLSSNAGASADEIASKFADCEWQVPESMRQMLTQAGYAIDSNGYLVKDASGKVAKDSIDVMDKKEDAKNVGKANAQGFADGVANKKGAAQTSGSQVASSAKTGLTSQQGQANTAGSAMSQHFAQGVGSNSGKANTSGAQVASSAKDGMDSEKNNASSWGSHLTENFAAGISGAIDFVANAANTVASKVKEILGHTVPKDGILHNHGKGEKPWGEHLVQNIAEGMIEARSEIEKAAEEIALSAAQPFDNVFNNPFLGANPFDSYKSYNPASKSKGLNKQSVQDTQIVVNNYSPKALNEKESARQFRISARQLAFS